MPTLNAVFKQVFGEALTPLGFKKIKGKYPYYVRVVEGGEIIHIITYKNGHPDGMFKTFQVLGGVATVYRPKIELDISPRDNTNWLSDVAFFYARPRNPNFDKGISKSVRFFKYKPDDDVSLLEAFKRSLDAVKEYVLPELDKATSLEKCIEYSENLGIFLRLYDEKENFGTNRGWDYCDGFILVKANKRDYHKEKMEKFIAKLKIMNKEFGEPYKSSYMNLISISERIFSEPELYKKVIAELEQRKTLNTDILKSYGLEI